MCNKYRSQTLEVPKNYVPNLSIEKQLEECIRRYPSNLDNPYVDFLVGVPGIGKTTAIKHIINKMRAERKWNEDVYYYSLRPEDDKDSQNSYD